jgi:hypothetical protein
VVLLATSGELSLTKRAIFYTRLAGHRETRMVGSLRQRAAAFKPAIHTGKLIGAVEPQMRPSSDRVHHFGIDQAGEVVRRHLRPFGAPEPVLLVLVQGREHGGDVRSAVGQVTKRPDLCAL